MVCIVCARHLLAPRFVLDFRCIVMLLCWHPGIYLDQGSSAGRTSWTRAQPYHTGRSHQERYPGHLNLCSLLTTPFGIEVLQERWKFRCTRIQLYQQDYYAAAERCFTCPTHHEPVPRCGHPPVPPGALPGGCCPR